MISNSLVGNYGGLQLCVNCANSRYPNGMGLYVAHVEQGWYLDAEFTEFETSRNLLQKAKFGKIRYMNSSRKSGRASKPTDDVLEPNVEFVGNGFVGGDSLGFEVRVIHGKTVSPGDELICSYPFPSLKEAQKLAKKKVCFRNLPSILQKFYFY